MRAFIVLCLVSVACADKLGYNYHPVAHSDSGLSFGPGSIGGGLSDGGVSLGGLSHGGLSLGGLSHSGLSGGSLSGGGLSDGGLSLGGLSHGGLSLGGLSHSGLSGGSLSGGGLSDGGLSLGGLSHGGLSLGGLSHSGLSGGSLSGGGLSDGGLSLGGLSHSGLSGGSLSGGGLSDSGLSLGGLSHGGLSGGSLSDGDSSDDNLAIAGLSRGGLSIGGLTRGGLSGGIGGGSIGGGSIGGDLSGGVSYDAAPVAEYEKEFYSFSAPEGEFDDGNAAQRIVGSVKQGLRVIFIKGPENRGLENAALALARQAAEQKTAIYVLNKQADIGDLAHQLNSINRNINNKPEVHFVKYRTHEDAANAQHAIQSQYDSLGGTSQSHNGGVAPVLNFASQAPAHVANVHAPGASYLPSSVHRT